MKKTSQRSLLFRQNVGRTEEEWAHFLDGYRQSLSLRLDFGRDGRGGDEGLARRRGGYLRKTWRNRGKNEVRPGAWPLGFLEGGADVVGWARPAPPFAPTGTTGILPVAMKQARHFRKV